MSVVFLDTVGLLALWDESDQWHTDAQKASLDLQRPNIVLMTTSFVLIECGNASARRPYRKQVSLLRAQMEEDGLVIHPGDREWEQAWSNYEVDSIHGAGIVDHVSFVVMRRLGIQRVFSNDRHFQTAGFETLF